MAKWSFIGVLTCPLYFRIFNHLNYAGREAGLRCKRLRTEFQLLTHYFNNCCHSRTILAIWLRWETNVKNAPFFLMSNAILHRPSLQDFLIQIIFIRISHFLLPKLIGFHMYNFLPCLCHWRRKHNEWQKLEPSKDWFVQRVSLLCFFHASRVLYVCH